MGRFSTSAAALLVTLAVMTGADAAQVIVHLPEDAGIRVTDGSPPPEGPRIDCPPDCDHASPGDAVDIFDLRVEPVLDPRTNDRPWDIVAMPGCRGTSALPADNARCSLPFQGNVDVYIQVQYRPMLAVTYTGTYGGPLSGFFITGTTAPGYQGAGTSFSCDITRDPQTTRCAGHFSANQPLELRSPSTNRATLLAVSPPCGGPMCQFTLTGDTCIQYEFKNGDPGFFPTIALAGPACPTGPGTSGGGSGGGGPNPPSPPTPVPDALKELKDYALQQMRAEFQQVLYPCLVTSSGVATFISLAPTGPAIPIVVGGGLVAAGGPLCAKGIVRLYQLQLIYNDPPNFDFDTITRIASTQRATLPLPSCAGTSGADRRLCRRLGRTLRRHVAKDDRATAVAEALRTTVEKASGALEADDARALRRQLKVAKKRRKQLDAALAARGKAGAKVATLLRDAGVGIPLDETQFDTASGLVLDGLAQQGVTDATARAALGEALAARSLDVLAVLGQPARRTATGNRGAQQ